MNLRFVEAFYWVASLKSVSRAAEKLFITQSAMSSRIAALEEELGVLLLDRRDKQFRLTVAGMRFHNHAAAAACAAARDQGARWAAAREARGLAAHRRHRIGAALLADRMGAGHCAQSTRSSSSSSRSRRRRCWSTRCGAVRSTSRSPRCRRPARGCAAARCRRWTMVFVGHAARAPQAALRARGPCGAGLLTFQRGSQPHVALLDLFREAGLQAQRVHTISSISAMVQLVEGGFGVATLAARRGAAPERAAAAEGAALRVARCRRCRCMRAIGTTRRSAVAPGVVDAVLDYIGTPSGHAGHRKNR